MSRQVVQETYPAGIYFHNANNGNARTTNEICSTLAIKTPEQGILTSLLTLSSCQTLGISMVYFVQMNSSRVHDFVSPKIYFRLTESRNFCECQGKYTQNTFLLLALFRKVQIFSNLLAIYCGNCSLIGITELMEIFFSHWDE